VRNTLEAMQFKCAKKDCDKVFPYKEAVKHQQEECISVEPSQLCPLAGCEEKKVSLDELQTHWSNECMKVDLECTNCNTTLKRADMEAHDCVKHFLKITGD
jgi:hypothetical protein